MPEYPAPVVDDPALVELTSLRRARDTRSATTPQPALTKGLAGQ